MALENFGAEQGYDIYNEDGDVAVSQIQGAGAPPGTSGISDAANIGSVWQDSTNGEYYIKKTDTSSAADWVKFVDQAALDIVNCQGEVDAVVGTLTELDTVLVDEYASVTWDVVISLDSAPARKKFIRVSAYHDGHAGADATDVKWKAERIVGFGTTFVFDVDVVLTGAAATQEMELQVAGDAGAAISARSVCHKNESNI